MLVLLFLVLRVSVTLSSSLRVPAAVVVQLGSTVKVVSDGSHYYYDSVTDDMVGFTVHGPTTSAGTVLWVTPGIDTQGARILASTIAPTLAIAPIVIASMVDGRCAPPLNVTTAVAVAAGERHICVLTATTGVWCGGSNANCQLGPAYSPAFVSDDGVVHSMDESMGLVSIVVFSTFTCGLRADSSGVCWGSFHRNMPSCNDRIYEFQDASGSLTEVDGIAIVAVGRTHVVTVVGGRRYTGASPGLRLLAPMEPSGVFAANDKLYIGQTQVCSISHGCVSSDSTLHAVPAVPAVPATPVFPRAGVCHIFYHHVFCSAMKWVTPAWPILYHVHAVDFNVSSPVSRLRGVPGCDRPLMFDGVGPIFARTARRDYDLVGHDSHPWCVRLHSCAEPAMDAVPPLNGVTALAAGSHHACILNEHGMM